jgi:hypothetical protein
MRSTRREIKDGGKYLTFCALLNAEHESRQRPPSASVWNEAEVVSVAMDVERTSSVMEVWRRRSAGREAKAGAAETERAGRVSVRAEERERQVDEPL